MQKVLVPIVAVLCLGFLGFIGYLFLRDPGPGGGQQPVAQGPGVQQLQPPSRPPAPIGPRVGETTPDIAGEDLDGRAFKLSDYRGKVVVLDFWGFW